MCIIIYGYQYIKLFLNRLDKTEKSMTNEIDLSCLENDHNPNWEQVVFESEKADINEEAELPEDVRRLLEREDRITVPSEDPVNVWNLGTADKPKELRIGALLPAGIRDQLIGLLQDYIDIFAWSYEDMPGLDTKIVQHQLPLKPECKPVQQKLRRMRPEMLLKIKEEVKKQWDAGFLSVSQYPSGWPC